MTAESAPFCLTFKVFHSEISLTQFLAARLVDAHHVRLPTLFSQGFILVDGQTARSEQGVSLGQTVKVYLPGHQEAAVDTRWRRVWENEELLALYKPHLLPVSRTTRNLYHTLISLVRRETPYTECQLLHRLDTETAGLIVLAKDKAADRKWKPLLNQLMVEKIYYAWVSGEPEWAHKEYACELSEKKGSLIRSQVYVVEPQASALFLKPKYSKTAFSVVQREPGRALIECQLFTGRKHQIRAQLAHLGHPLLGDKIYAHQGWYYLQRLERALSEQDYQRLTSRYQRLEAVKLVLSLPERVEITTDTYRYQ
ncbi:MAG: RluA family pseudouridine synthase [Neptuniibacter pectenicola]|jgi:RluA family pseudouridine synthase